MIEEDGYTLESIECISTPEQTKGFIYLLGIEGMMCGHCVKSVTKKLSGLDGVVHCEVSLENKSAQVESSKPITESEFKKALEEDGYELTGFKE
ncbi:heavy metal-associated domain-containing protein [uncultured Parasutterella sp.]|uniref:heavy-metal-associated domain-containing protein n=1 Tax=uncultured Parasutterella sp. TaxID=1263098 RepID=UPI002595C36B|nr:heavy metal-associated domain-containing protein [uncultured Parasutterella sp.]